MQIANATIALLDDVLLFLTKINSTNYVKSITPLFNSSLGKHTRHVIELYQCLLLQTKTGVVNYDARKRDLQIEMDKKFAIKAIKAIQQQLLTIEEDSPLLLASDLLADQKIASNLFRELLYNYDHCVHHLALIKVGLHFVQPDIDLPKRFGVAISTIKHQQDNC